MVLDQELETYARELPALAAMGEGKFVVIRGQSVAGVFDTYADALKHGYEKFGLDGFLVKQIHLLEKAMSFTRNIVPCPT